MTWMTSPSFCKRPRIGEQVGSIGVATGVSYGLKEAFPERRPDGSDKKSFPSGHTSMSFAAAATIQNRYGWKAGLPAQLVAAFVGLSRVEAHKHHVHDVLVGAAIGEASGFLITRKANDRVQVFPWGGTQGGGAPCRCGSRRAEHPTVGAHGRQATVAKVCFPHSGA